MIEKKLEAALNDQINYEFYSAHIYLSLANYCTSIGLDGFENWFLIQYQEEVFHARKFMQYLNERGGRVLIKGFKDPETEFNSILHAFEVSLGHEQKVTKRINDIALLSRELNDFATSSFIQWFVDEQVEEEDNASTLINKIKLVKDSGLYMLDQEVAKRVFVAPTE